MIVLRSPTDRVVAGERLASLSLSLSLQVGSPFRLLGLPLLASVALLLLSQEFLDNGSDTVDFVPKSGEGVLQILHFGPQRVRLGLRIASGCRCCRRSGARDAERIKSLLLRRQGRVEVGILRPQGSDDPFEICCFRPSARSECPSVKPPSDAARRKHRKLTFASRALVAQQDLDLAPHPPRLFLQLPIVALTPTPFPFPFRRRRSQSRFELGDPSCRVGIVAFERGELAREGGESLSGQVGCRSAAMRINVSAMASPLLHQVREGKTYILQSWSKLRVAAQGSIALAPLQRPTAASRAHRSVVPAPGSSRTP